MTLPANVTLEQLNELWAKERMFPVTFESMQYEGSLLGPFLPKWVVAYYDKYGDGKLKMGNVLGILDENDNLVGLNGIY